MRCELAASFLIALTGEGSSIKL